MEVRQPNKKEAKKFIETSATENLKRIYEKFDQYGFDLRIVGGAVRDWLMNLEPRDIDFATNALPTEIIYLCNEIDDDTPEEDEVVAVHGIRHGTIVMVFSEEEQYEITSLDFLITKEGNKLFITQEVDWKADAERRDFTVNAMSMDENGTIHDYFGGIEDLKNQKIEFLGDFKARITNYPVLILRFLKLLSKFPEPKYDQAAVDYMKENIDLLKEIEPDTIKWFIAQIKSQKYSKNALNVMEEIGIELGQFNESLFKAYLNKMHYLE